MSREYFLTPKEAGTFPDAILIEARKYWERKPIYLKSNGVIRCAESVELRDSIVESGRQDQPQVHALWIAPRSERITLGTYGIDIDMELYEFAKWLQALQPIRILDDFDREMSLEKFRELMAVSLET
jgi:hypothetical protein